MARPKFVELIIIHQLDTPKHPLSGYVIVSDYRDEAGRHLFLKRNEAVPVRKEKKREKVTEVS